MIHESFALAAETLSLGEQAEQALVARFSKIDATAAYNTQKVLSAMHRHHIAEQHFFPTTGYGYGDIGREAIDGIFADLFGAEAALVSHFMLSGTHALTVGLFGLLRPGDLMLSIAGKPYDTLDSTIGLDGQGKGSLMEFGVRYAQVDLKADGTLDYDAITAAVAEHKPKIAYLQRSRGYEIRPSITIEETRKAVEAVRAAAPDTWFVVDNCYCEFVEKQEPCEVGADLCIGSLIKNPGGSFALCGGYIAGRADLVELCSCRLTTPGLGSEIGASLGQNRDILRGIYWAPFVTGEALKTACYAAKIFELLGFACSPGSADFRTDIVQQIRLESRERLIAFCRGIQAGSPVDSFVSPEPSPMPGYADEVIMAAGAFVQGSSIELSADGPLRPPFAVFMQGGTLFHAAKIGILLAADRMRTEGLL